MKARELLSRLKLSSKNKGVFNGTSYTGSGIEVPVIDPTTNQTFSSVRFGTPVDYEDCIQSLVDSRKEWAKIPMPVRGTFLKRLSKNIASKKEDLASLITLEIGKIIEESRGEVQEFIDICDMAIGMSRTITGSIIPSERKNHLILETWSPVSQSIGIITAFNFPHAVFGWNAVLALLCGGTFIIKGSETASLTTIATHKILIDTLKECSLDTRIATMCQGQGSLIGSLMTNDPRLELVSFTGSTKTGSIVAGNVAKRFGKSILELGGNNATIIMPDADMKLALDSVMFSALGLTGQRCTSLRRLLIHEDVYGQFISDLLLRYSDIKIGDPFDKDTTVGPLHSISAVNTHNNCERDAKSQGGLLLNDFFSFEFSTKFNSSNFVCPLLFEINPYAKIVTEENFVPIVYVSKFKTFEEAIEINNSVSQGLSSSIFTRDINKVMKWMSSEGSDCGLINVNTSTSGAEIGGAFGGNKNSGWGRESGSDSWKLYMRRGTSTINYGTSTILAQGLKL